MEFSYPHRSYYCNCVQQTKPLRILFFFVSQAHTIQNHKNKKGIDKLNIWWIGVSILWTDGVLDCVIASLLYSVVQSQHAVSRSSSACKSGRRTTACRMLVFDSTATNDLKLTSKVDEYGSWAHEYRRVHRVWQLTVCVNCQSYYTTQESTFGNVWSQEKTNIRVFLVHFCFRAFKIIAIELCVSRDGVGIVA